MKYIGIDLHKHILLQPRGKTLAGYYAKPGFR